MTNSLSKLKGNILLEKLFVCSNYLIGLIFRSLREMSSNACKKNTSKQTAIIVLVQYLYHQYKHLPLSSSVMMMSLLCSMLHDWFANSARMIAKAGHPVEWVTPLGMPVVQPYHKEVTKGVSPSVYLSLLFIPFVSSPLLL